LTKVLKLTSFFIFMPDNDRWGFFKNTKNVIFQRYVPPQAAFLRYFCFFRDFPANGEKI